MHRDLKPSNVLLDGVDESAETFDPTVSCKITDFGLAKSGSEDSDLTRSGAIVGTIAYLAPEQANAGLTPVGPSADLFCLGLMLYELLTLKSPFQKASPLDTLAAIRDCAPLSPRQLNPGISRDLESVCLKCLEKAPTARYASATDLANDLRRVLRGEPVLARPIRNFDRLVRWCYRHPLNSLLIATSLGLFLVAVSGITLQWQRAEKNLTMADFEYQRAEQSLQQADAERALAESNLQLAQESIDEFLVLFANDLQNVPQMDDKRRMLLTRALQFQEQLLESYGDRPRVRLQKSQAHYRIARIQGQLGEFETAIEQCDLALAEFRQAQEQTQELQSGRPMLFEDLEFDTNLFQRDILRERSKLLKLARRVPEAVEDMQQAIIFGRKYVEQHPDHAAMQRGIAEDLRSLGILFTGLRQRDLAGQYFRDALSQLDSIQGEECLTERFRMAKASCLNSLAVHQRSNDNPDDALQALWRSH